MKEYLSEVSFVVIPAMTVLSGVAIGAEPEEEISGKMERLADTFGINVRRSFGFDSPVTESENKAHSRGYEYWLVLAAEELEKLPDPKTFDFEGTAFQVKPIPGYRYATLRVEEPFADPFERIGTGWRVLVDWLDDHDLCDSDFGPPPDAACLEEINVIDGKTCMDLYIPVDLA